MKKLYNTRTGAIREIVSNHPSSFAIGTDQFMDESAAVLGILDYYPEKYAQCKRGIFRSLIKLKSLK
ncbi:MAG: hypothetical protein IKN45_09915, partial [Lachnospiraceae bacterium]|nr:hypothetical protein [Lachnospiraceae bacterium]